MTRKGEAPAVARGLGLRVAGPQSSATGKKKNKKTQPLTPNSGVRGWQAHVPGKAGFRVVLSGEGVPAPKRDLQQGGPSPSERHSAPGIPHLYSRGSSPKRFLLGSCLEPLPLSPPARIKRHFIYLEDPSH